MAAANTPSTILDVPPEGVTLAAAFRLSPLWPDYKRLEILRMQRHNSLDVPEVSAWVTARWRLTEWLHDRLATGEWVLKAYRSEKLWGEPVAFPPDITRRLKVETDNQTILGPDGQRFYAPMIFPLKIAPEQRGGRITLKALLEGVVHELPFPEPKDRTRGWQTRWAEKAADLINERQRKDPGRVKRTTAQSVYNRMLDSNLWPK